ncbi:MAG: carbohydrate-binding protein [Ignavibacteriales bacterium]|nr:carbohydrate-binding protein [Ignavibacteriales bacterium]
MKALLISALLVSICFDSTLVSAQIAKATKSDAVRIVIGAKASELERFASKELQRYLYQLSGTLPEIRTDSKSLDCPTFIIGQTRTNSIVARLASTHQVEVSPSDPGPQGYVLKKTLVNKQPALVIAGSDEVGCLYGVYGLLTDYYRVGFFLGGDILPDSKSSLTLVDVDEKKSPSMYVRGFLPWTNFPQSATSYSWEDWKFILDQMAKMRLNFIHIHNYNGELGHNEMYHNFVYKGFTSRVWMPTARQAHAWAMSPWDVNKYRFGASDLFDDYDFGADCALHNENLSNEEVFRKSASLFQKVIDYAHSRGVKVGLGLDIDLIPKEYKAQADDPEVVRARVDQLVNDYPNLDYLLCFQSENVGKDPRFYEIWKKIFTGFYDGVKLRMPRTRVAVAGWGLNPASIATLPPDVICAPISYYSDRCETGAIYGDREYWGCPWLERDFYSSEYYYPYNLHLKNTIAAFKERAPNMKGFYCLTWRLTDAVEPKMWYVARAPWDGKGDLNSAETVYEQYAALAYGPRAAKDIAGIINQNEPFASDYAECEGTPPFGRLDARGLFQIARFRFFKDHPESVQERSAATYSEGYGIGKNRCEEGGECVDWIDAGEWARFADVDFGVNATTFEVRVASATEGGIIELRLDSAAGPVIGSCTVRNTGGLQQWSTAQGAILPTSGKHTLHMNFLSNRDPFRDYAKAIAQLKVIDEWIAGSGSSNQKTRLGQLRSRIAAAKDHIELNKNFGTYTWADLPGATESWARNFTSRVTDISSLGNVMSMQNRYIQRNYAALEDTLRKGQTLKAPTSVSVRGTKDGVIVRWASDDPNAAGFTVYRSGEPVNEKSLARHVRFFVDRLDGVFSYSVTARGMDGKESPLSVPVVCAAGKADSTAPQIVLVSPPGTGVSGQPAWIKARILDTRSYDEISAKLYYRAPEQKKWNVVPMDRRTKAVFAAEIPGTDLTGKGVQYYIEASDGTNTAVYPPSSPAAPLSIAVSAASDSKWPLCPANIGLKERKLTWDSIGKDAFWYRIYRSNKPGFKAGPANLVTYVAAGTTGFKDNGEGFDGAALKGDWYYRVTAVSRSGVESPATPAVKIVY